MNSLSDIKSHYPKSIKAKPKGWKFIVGDTIIRKGDMIWTKGVGPFINVADSSNTVLVGGKADGYVPIIREIQAKPKTNMYTLTEAQQKYYGIKEVAIPAGYRVLKTDEKGGENCRCLLFRDNVFGHIIPDMCYGAVNFAVYIAPIKKKKEEIVPKITPLPEVLKTSLPKGYVYLGKGGEFKSCGSDVGKFIYTTDGKAWRNDNTYMMSGPSCYYAFPDDSEIVKLNGVKPNIPSLLEENAALKKELADLKAKVAAFIEGMK